MRGQGSADGLRVDFFAAEVVDALSLPGCPLCSVMAAHERRYVEGFWDAARDDLPLRERFWSAGGFCPRHGRHLDRHLAERGQSAAMTTLLRGLVERDLAELDALVTSLESRRHGRIWPTRPARCPACLDAERALPRKAGFLLDALADPRTRERYVASDGPCAPHLGLLVSQGDEAPSGVLRFVLEDWRERLETLGLTAGGPVPGARAREAVRRYTGETPWR